MAIQRPKDRLPILREEEIAVCAEEAPDRTAKEKRLIELLRDLNPQTSRAVVFVTSRRLAEELADLVKQQTELTAAPFHAGLAAEVRLETYEQFRDGALTVLCATKAFGLGMDIDNIHLIVHFSPPSSLEDYLQEIGRAARKPESLQDAGLEKATARLLYEPGDFRRMHDRLKNDFLSSLDLKELHDLLVKEWEQAGSPTEHPLSIQLEWLANRFRGVGGTTNQVRTGFYWLERLGRIQVGFYTPAQVEVEIDLTRAHAARPALSQEARGLLDYLQRDLDTKTGQCVVNFQVRDARKSLGVPSQDQLFVHLAELARRGVIRYRRELLLPLAERRARESRDGMVSGKWPLLDTALAAMRQLCKDLDLGTERTYRRDELKQLFEEIAAQHFRPEDFTGLDVVEREEQAQRERKGFLRRVPAVLRLLRALNIVRVRQEVNSDGLTLYLSLHRKDWGQWLDALPTVVKESLKQIVAQEQTKETLTGDDLDIGDDTGVGEVDAQELLLVAQKAAQSYRIPFSISHLQAILRFLRDLGYLQRADVFVPMTLEVRVIDRHPIVLDRDDQDARILDRFGEQKRSRVLRLAALQAVPDLVSDPEKLRKFVEQRYFQVASSQELIALLEEYLPAENEILSQMRQDALIELLKGLSDQQREVYDASLDRHLMVVAGPGAGKTHTLLARLVRLVHVEDVQASEILVLAFTRAVVSELRYRLQDLLGRLGYGTLARDIRVTTFHSFVLRTLREFNLIPDDFRLGDRDCFEEFEKHLRENPALRRHVATRYRYVLVDEFQDVHGARYRLLDYLAQGRQTYLLIVGDDDQSVYDYERPAEEGNATQYFKDFADRFEPLHFCLTRNYRSARAIVDLSQGIVDTLPGRLKVGQSLEPVRSAQGVAEWRQGTDLLTLVREVEQGLNAVSDKRSRHNTIAILARTNADVYRIKAQLQQGLGEGFSLLVQGEESRFIDRRDVAEVMDWLRDDQHDGPLTRTRLVELLGQHLSRRECKCWLRNQPPEQHELWYLAEEFLDGAGHEATMADFKEYVREMSKNGNYLRVVARRQAAEGGKGRILLSTIHKVKGIEFPAVILVDSDMRVEDVNFELRVMYVGMTRAEDILFILKGEREERLLQQQPFEPTDQRRHDLVVAPCLGDVYISFFGGHHWRYDKIRENVRTGDQLQLRRYGKETRIYLENTNHYIGRLALPNAETRNLAWRLDAQFPDVRVFNGLEMTGIYRRYVEQDKRYDEKHSTDFHDRLCSEVKGQGFYYVVEIGGLVRPG